MNTLCSTHVGIIVNSVPECDHGLSLLKPCPQCDDALFCDDCEPEQEYFSDEVKSCPDCEAPNQFGERCQRCIADSDFEETEND